MTRNIPIMFHYLFEGLMLVYTPTEFFYILEAYVCSEYFTFTAQRQFLQPFLICEAPSRQLILCALQKFRENSDANFKHSSENQTRRGCN